MIRAVRPRSLTDCHCRRLLSSGAVATAAKDPVSPPVASSSLHNVEAAAAAASSAAGDEFNSLPQPTPSRTLPTILKFGLAGAVTGIFATAGYATFAYTSEEVNEKATSLRAYANQKAGDEASGVEKFQTALLSGVMTVPAKAVDLYLDLRRSVEEQVKGFTEPLSDKLLPDLHPMEQHVFTLVLDLNETLVYSDWKRDRGWRTFKRPGVDAFLEHLAQFYEIVVYSDEQSMYVDPVMERLDAKGCVRYRLSRPATKYENGKHYRDFSKLNRDPSRILYVSGHALESTLQPENSVPIKPWKTDMDDTALIDLLPFLEYIARNRPADIRPVLASYQGQDIATEFIARTKEHQRRMQEQKQQSRFWKR